jgi:hypothetical protein
MEGLLLSMVLSLVLLPVALAFDKRERRTEQQSAPSSLPPQPKQRRAPVQLPKYYRRS